MRCVRGGFVGRAEVVGLWRVLWRMSFKIAPFLVYSVAWAFLTIRFLIPIEFYTSVINCL